MMKIKVGIVEDDANNRYRLMQLIHKSKGLKCKHTFETAEEAIAKIPVLNLDVVLVDIQLPHVNGIDCVAKLKPFCADTQFLMLTHFEDTDLILRALKAGASGYLSKTTQNHKIIEAIIEIHNGGAPLNSHIAKKIVTSFQLNNNENCEIQKLSDREKEILNLLSHGLKYQEIALQLFISTETVRTHIRNIYEKLQVHSRTAAINKINQK